MVAFGNGVVKMQAPRRDGCVFVLAFAGWLAILPPN